MVIKRLLYIYLLVLVFTNCNAQQKEFKIFNALLYKNTPNLKGYGFHEIFLFYEDDLNDLPNDLTTSSGRNINVNKVINSARKAAINPNIPVCLDIESWPLDGDHKNKSKEKYKRVISLFKKHNSRSKLGYFGVYPMDSPHAEYSFNSEIRSSVIMPNWHKINNYFKDIGNSVDIFFPVFYTRFKDLETWEKIVKEKVNKIKEINPSGKIYGFIWPHYYTDNGKFPFIEKNIWQRQLEIVYKYCDGAVIWSHYNGPNGTPINFSKNMGWFKITLDFMEKNNIK